MSAFYNEFDPSAAEWLRNLIAAGLIAPGVVDTRSIADVQPADLDGFTQVHFFAGIGGWSAALRLAGWADDRPAWTGSCPCQPFSAAGKRGGTADARHLWPEMRRLVAECRPASVFGEQVASADGRNWLAGVRADLEALGYAVGAADLCAAGVGAPHIRQRLFWMADAMRDGDECRGGPGKAHGAAGSPESETWEWQRRGSDVGDGVQSGGRLADADGRFAGNGHVQPGGQQRQQPEDRGAGDGLGNAEGERRGKGVGHVDCASGLRQGAGYLAGSGEGDHWSGAGWFACSDGKARRVEPGIFPLAHGVSGRVAVRRSVEQAGAAPSLEEHWYSRVGALRGIGNAIVPQVAAEFIAACEECRP